ncbi:hypothetical protein JTB14_006972 [Gonioctena quinquepunctata]|nr:hypothetical protein JTB14_006972 [Gonioctena quinquepunctata]
MESKVDHSAQENTDPCLFLSLDKQQIVAVYVDDLLILGSSHGKVKIVEDILAQHFGVTFLGIPKYLLSIQISWQENYLALFQEQYIHKLLEKYNFLNCKPTSTPMDCGTRLERAKPGDSRTDKELYQSKIGSLLYLVMGTRPDITHTVNVLSQYCVDPSTIHNSSVHHLFRYLKGSMHYKLIYKPVGSPSLKLYSDASFANSLDDRRSYTGFVAFYGGSVVCWCTKKQQSVAVPTTEAEYMALSSTCRQAMWMSQLLEDLGQNIKPLLLCDNQSSIHLSVNPVMHQRSKHIDIHYHYTRERFLNADVIITYVASKGNFADLF